MFHQFAIHTRVVGKSSHHGRSPSRPADKEVQRNLPFPGWFFEQRDFVVARFGSRLREGSPGGTAADHVQLAASLGLATNFCEPPLAFKAGNEIAQRHRIAHLPLLPSVRSASRVPPSSSPAAKAEDRQPFLR